MSTMCSAVVIYGMYFHAQPKRALESFVEAGGLSCLQKVLVIWMRKPMTHSGALLILKVEFACTACIADNEPCETRLTFSGTFLPCN